MGLKVLLPYSTLLYTDDLIIPLKEEFLRESSDSLIFKYDSTVNILGKITRQHKKESNQGLDLAQTAIQSVSDMVVGAVKGFNPDLIETPYIVSPIAIYVS